MKRIFALLTICVLVTALLFTGCGSGAEKNKDADDYVIEWADSSLEYAVRQHLGKPVGDIYASDLAFAQLITIKDKLVQFNNGDYYRLADVGPMTTLEDLSHFPKLGSVALSETSLNDLSPLAGVEKLQQLLLYDNKQISDISVITGMDHLVVLALYDNAITDFTPILEVDSLKELELKRNRATALDFTGHLPRLSSLKIDIRDQAQFDSLPTLANLVELDLSGNRLSNLEPLADLAGLEHLTKLDLSSNQIDDLTPISSLTGLTSLDVSKNRLTSLSGIEGMTGLVRLNIERNEISDLSVLKNMKPMKYLSAANNQIHDVSALSALSNLEELELGGNQVSNLVAFEKMKSLRKLDLSQNPLAQTEVEQLDKTLRACEITF